MIALTAFLYCIPLRGNINLNFAFPHIVFMVYGDATTSKGWGIDYEEKHSVMLAESWLEAITARPGLPDCMTDFLFVAEKGFTTGYCSAKQFEKSKREGRVFLDGVKRRAFEELCADGLSKANAFFEEFKALRNGLRSFSDAELLALFEKYFSMLVAGESLFKMSSGRAYPLVEAALKEELAKRFAVDELEEKYALLLTPTTIDVMQREEADLLRLAERCEGGEVAGGFSEEELQRDLRRHADDYALLFYNTYDRERVDSFLRERLKQARLDCENKSSEEFLRGLRADKQALAEKQRKLEAKINRDAAELAGFLRRQGSFRFEMKGIWSAEYRFLELFEEIARRAGLNVEEFFAAYATRDVKALLRNGVRLSDEERRERRNYYVFFVLDGVKGFLLGGEARRFAFRVLGEETAFKELKGTPASPGIARGRVRVIASAGLAEFVVAARDFKDGDVLVTMMTQPNMFC